MRDGSEKGHRDVPFQDGDARLIPMVTVWSITLNFRLKIEYCRTIESPGFALHERRLRWYFRRFSAHCHRRSSRSSGQPGRLAVSLVHIVVMFN